MKLMLAFIFFSLVSHVDGNRLIQCYEELINESLDPNGIEKFHLVEKGALIQVYIYNNSFVHHVVFYKHHINITSFRHKGPVSVTSTKVKFLEKIKMPLNYQKRILVPFENEDVRTLFGFNGDVSFLFKINGKKQAIPDPNFVHELVMEDKSFNITFDHSVFKEFQDFLADYIPNIKEN